MSRLRILAISDVAEWDHARLLKRYRPDVVVLGGDLVSDGYARFFRNALDEIPQYRKAKKALLTEFETAARRIPALRSVKRSVIMEYLERVRMVTQTKKTEDAMRKIVWDFEAKLDDLKDRFRATDAFRRARWKLHVNRFYSFLKHAGKTSKVLVVFGDHDHDFEGDYLPERIDAIPGCSEVSGKTLKIGNVTFLGLGFKECHYRTQLRNLLGSEKPDVIVAHAEQANMDLIANFRAKLVIRGHFGVGRFLVGGSPALFTAGPHHSIIDFESDGPVHMKSFEKLNARAFREINRSSCKPWFTTESEFDRYSWLQPYPGTGGQLQSAAAEY